MSEIPNTYAMRITELETQLADCERGLKDCAEAMKGMQAAIHRKDMAFDWAKMQWSSEREGGVDWGAKARYDEWMTKHTKSYSIIFMALKTLAENNQEPQSAAYAKERLAAARAP